MASLGDLVANVKMDSRQFISGAGKAERSLGSFVKSSVSGLAQVGLAANTLKMAWNAMIGPMKEAQEAALAERKLAQVFKTTGHAAGFAKDEIVELAKERQKLTSFDADETVNAAAILGSFTGIKGDVFTRALMSAQDLSAFMGQDLQSSILMVGKALNDPVKGITALTRAGVSFTAQQKEQIKTLQEAGKLVEAQNMILKEMQVQFGGQAEALADPIKQAENAWGDFMESVGELGVAALPVLDPLLDGLKAITEEASNGAKIVGELVDRGMMAGFGSQVDTQALGGLASVLPDASGLGQFRKAEDAKRERNTQIVNRAKSEGIIGQLDEMLGVNEQVVFKQQREQEKMRNQSGQMLAGIVRDGIEGFQRGFMSLGPAGKDGGTDNQVGSLERGSNEAFETLRANMGQGAKDLQKDQLKELEKVNKNLEKLAKAKAKEGETFVVKDVD